MWFVPTRYNYLCCYNLKTEEVEKKFRLPEKNAYHRLYENILSHDGRLYLIPFNGSDVLVFDKQTEGFERISMAPYDNLKYRFCAAVIYQGTLYMFPERVDAEIENPYVVVSVDLLGKKIIQELKLDVWVGPAGKALYEVFGRQVFVVENHLYILLQRTNQVLHYDLERNIAEVYEVNGRENKYAVMYVDRDTFYFIDQEGNVTIWDKFVNTISKYENTISGYEVEKKDLFGAFSASFEYDDKIYFVPRYANKILEYRNEKIVEAPFSKAVQAEWKKYESNWMGRFLSSVENNNTLYLFDGYNYKFHIVNLITGECKNREISATFTQMELKDMYDEFLIQRCGWYNEDGSVYLNLEYLLKNMQDEKNKQELDKRDSIGKDILQRIVC